MGGQFGVRTFAVALSLASSLTLSATGAGASVPGQALWVARYNPVRAGFQEPTAEATSADGAVLYVAGTLDAPDGARYGLVAYKTRHGGEVWASSFDGPDGVPGTAYSVALSPDGSLVFVTGVMYGVDTVYGTAAYDASTGSRVWLAVYDGSDGRSNVAYSIAASPDGSKVFVTGASWGGGADNGPDYATVAYAASSGQQLWVQRYSGAGNYYDQGESVAVSPDGRRVFVTGYSNETTTNVDATTIAYDSSTGNQLWLSRFNGAGNVNDEGKAVVVSPDGKTLYVTGRSWWSDNNWENTVAYDTATGVQLWARRRGNAGAAAIAVSPDGSRVYVAGTVLGVPYHPLFGTWAFDTAGHRLWMATHSEGTGDIASSIAVSPEGSRVYVTGTSEGSVTRSDYATVSYVSSTGVEAWHATYEGPTQQSDDTAYAVVVSPDSAKVYVTGVSRSAFRTVAYTG